MTTVSSLLRMEQGFVRENAMVPSPKCSNEEHPQKEKRKIETDPAKFSDLRRADPNDQFRINFDAKPECEI